MNRFERYFLMTPEDVVEYAKEQLKFFNMDSALECREIGDGNLNYVFVVRDPESSKSVIVKQAGETARISNQFKLSPDRNKIEAGILKLQGTLAPGLVPVVYRYDDVMKCCAMEDLSDHTIMRQAVIRHEKFPLFADQITTFMACTLLLTTDVVMGHKEKKKLVAEYINPELCEITEDLVYTEPYNDCNNRNMVFAPNLEWVRQEIYGDLSLRREAAKLKFEFMTNAQALIHGDLHTGSIFIRQDSLKVIDPEFAFYGPMGYDVGKVVANLIFVWVNAWATIADEAERAGYLRWVENTIVDVVDLFREKFLRLWKERATDILARDNGFRDWYLDTVIRDTAAAAGLEMNRRVIGIAKVRDLTSIADEKARVRAERICMTAAKQFIMERDRYRAGANFLETVKQAERQVG